MELLSEISSINTRHVEGQTLPLLFSSLPDKAPLRSAVGERAKCWRVLSALSKLCVPQELFEIFVIRLSTKLDLICLPTASASVEDESTLEPSAAYAYSILTALANTLQVKVDRSHTDVPKYIDRLVSRLYNLMIFSTLLPSNEIQVAENHRVIHKASHIITLIVQTLPIQ